MNREELLAYARTIYYPGVTFQLVHLQREHLYTIKDDDVVSFLPQYDSDNSLVITNNGVTVTLGDNEYTTFLYNGHNWAPIKKIENTPLNKIRNWLYETD